MRPSGRPWPAWLPNAILVVVFLAVATALGAAIGANAPSVAGVLVAATGVAVIGPVASRLMRGGVVDLLEPVVLYVLAYGTMFVVRPAYMVLTRTDGYYTLAGTSVDISSTFVSMQALALVGAVAFGVAYELTVHRGQLTSRRWGAPAPPRLSFGVVTLGAIALLVAGAVGTVLRVRASGGLGIVLAGRSTDFFAAQLSASKFLLLAPIPLIPAGLLFFALWLRSRRVLDLAGFGACFVLMIVAFGFTGGRIQFLPFFLAPIVYYFLTTAKRPRLRTVAVGLLVALAVSAVVAESRNADVRQQVGLSSAVMGVVTDPVSIFKPLTEGQDAAMAPALAAALTVVPESVGFTYGRATVGDFGTRVVPRALWPGKPVAARENVVRAIWTDTYYSGVANPEFSALLSWYLDGGPLGVIVGFGLYGMLFAALYRYVRRRGGGIEASLIFAAALPLGVRALRDSPTDVATQAVFIVAPIAIVLGLARRAYLGPSHAKGHA